MESNWFKAQEFNNITIVNNTFGSFDSMILEGSNDIRCIFSHNKFTALQPDSFKSIGQKCQLKQMIFHQNCNCKFSAWLATVVNVKDVEAESYCTLSSDDILIKCLNAETVKFQQYYDEICSKSAKNKKKLNCAKVKVDKIEVQFLDPKELSDDFDIMEYINYIIGGLVIIVLLPCICIVISKKKKPSTATRRDDNYNTNNSFHQTDLLHLNQSEGPPSYEASLRSTKSFSNHDRIIIKQTLETMKQKQPEDKYELVYNNTQRLLHEHLNEYEKVKIIGDIVQTIGECENSGEDFVAFTDILYKHLAPDTTTTLRSTTVSQLQPSQTNDDLYSEPVLPQNNSNSTATSANAAARSSRGNAEHIYAEPTMLTQQQTMIPLLLANNYSNPLDSNVNVNNNLISNNNVYSEPIMHDVPNTKTAALGKFKNNHGKNIFLSSLISRRFFQTTHN